MTKRKLLLEVARAAVLFGEGSDFDFREVVLDAGAEDTLCLHYGVTQPDNDNDDDLERYDECYGRALSQCQKDVAALLDELSKKST